MGDPAAPRALLLHGIMGHAREWDMLAEELAATFRVIVLDQRGHGGSDRASEYTASAMAADVAGVIEALGLSPVRVIAPSMGAMAASLCAAERPELVERLVIIDIGPDSVSSEQGREALTAFLRALGDASYADPAEAVDQWLAGNPRAREPLMRHYVEHALVRRGDGRLGWGFDAHNLIGFVTDGVDAEELWSAVDAIAAPTLVIRGGCSELLSPATAAEMVRRLRHGRLVEIPGGGHDLGVEQPEAVAAAALPFLRA